MEKNRWAKAQASEKNFWEESLEKNIQNEFQKMCLDFYPIYIGILTRNGFSTEGMRMIDIGSGPYGFLSVVPGKEKCLIDPLMDYFMEKIPAKFYVDHNLSVYSGVGEDLPFDNRYFDLACCVNTLDHAANPKMVMFEANRCLKDGGYLLLSCNHYAKPIVMYRKLLEFIGAGDTNHPNTYTKKDIYKLIFDNGFEVIDQKIGDTKEMKKIISNVGGDTNVSLIERLKRAVKSKGKWYTFKQILAYPGHKIVNSLFKTYPDSIFLCKKC